jgi:hypothetical protein
MKTTAETNRMPDNTTVRHRSPNYPLFDLESAISKVRVFQDQQKRNIVDFDSASESLGYKPNAYGGRAIATMLGYGLVDEIKGTSSRRFRISETARDLIVTYGVDDPEWKEIVRNAALKPKIYSQLVSRFPHELPSDKAIRQHLLVEMKFNEDVVLGVIRDFKKTYKFANLGTLDALSEDYTDKIEDGRNSDFDVNDRKTVVANDKSRISAPQIDFPSTAGTGRVSFPETADTFSLPIPLPGRRFATVQFPPRMTHKEYDRIVSFLKSNRDVVLEDGLYPNIRIGAAIWHAADRDRPVTVIESLGEQDGCLCVRIDGSDFPVPYDQIEYNG